MVVTRRMRTYSKRHNRSLNKTVFDDVLDGQADRKRIYHSEAEGRPMKRKKTVEQPAMSGPFETPHPTMEANSLIYKLPSTKPIPSPTPFSPVPAKLDLRQRSSFVPTTSASFKENAGIRKSFRRQSSKTLSSFTLTSGSGPASRNTRENGKQTRSPSRSSNSASSRSRSRDQTRLSKFKAKLIRNSKSKPNVTVDDLGEHLPSKSRESFSKSQPFTKRNKNKSMRRVSNTEQTLLASPFTSRAPSPIGNPAIAKSGMNESMGPPALTKLATRDTRGLSNSKKGRLSLACDAFSSPEKPVVRKRSSARLFNQGITNENDFSWKNRRPSAPSNLQRPSKPVGKAHTPAKRAPKTSHKQFKEENEVNPHEYRTSALSYSIDPIKDCGNQLIVELKHDPDPFFWMQERSAVDFNRPPSQLSLHLSSGFIHAEADVEAEGVFWSSGEDEDGNDDQPNRRLGANPESTNSAWLTSTPLRFKKVIARHRSLPVLEGPSVTPPKSRRSMDASSMIEAFIGENDKTGEDMELTAPLKCRGNTESCQKDSMSFQEHTPWIIDSIISPPTAYSERKKFVVVEKGVDENVEKKEQVPTQPRLKIPSLSSSIVLTQTGVLSSPLRSSYADSTSSVVESVSIGLREPAVAIQELKEENAVIDGTEDKDTVQPQGPPQRTRSGTILARNGPSFRRTRTGTIVGPSTVGRTRSGTIVAQVKIPEQNGEVVANWRARSGSVIGPVPDPSGKKGVKSSTSAAEAEEAVRTVVDGESTQIEKTCTGNVCESSIKEVNEPEYYVDSLYLTSSPDPIDFLTGPKIVGDESALVVSVGDWRVADEPPSPEVRRTKKTIQTPRGMVSRSIARRFKLKGHRKNRARFVGADGQVEDCDFDNHNLNFGDGLNDTSDDELLLVEGQSQSLFG